ncbi:hypothetical protein K439DRAFT_1621322 [Ramaria rubella]|nr:hypothetical protein K439DRAFT_1621322 [Ramaria rubella]
MVPVAWWDSESEKEHMAESTYISNHAWLGDMRWIDPFTISGTCASSLADVKAQGHQRYSLRINVYGWACCSCPRFNQNRGACRHLWAMRISLPKFIATKEHPYQLRFPVTEAEAHEVYVASFNSTPPSQIRELPPPQLPPSGPAPVAPTMPMTENLDAMVERAKDWLSTTAEIGDEWGDREPGAPEPDSDAEDSSACEEDAIVSLSSGVTQQPHTKISHLTQMLLPQLHGLGSAFDDCSHQSVHMAASPDLHELREICLKLYMNIGHLTGTVGSDLTPSLHVSSHNAFSHHAKVPTDITEGSICVHHPWNAGSIEKLHELITD